MKNRYILLAFACLMAGAAQAQVRIGFTNTTGFPSYVNNGQSVTLSGWVVNRGTDTLSGAIDVHMLGSNGQPAQIDNNFGLSSPVPPGDSVLWTKPSYTFPAGRLAPGHNDVLIWPTKSTGTGTLSDTIVAEIFYAEAAAFAMQAEGLTEWQRNGIDMERSYSVTFHGTNIGTKPSEKEVGLFMKAEGKQPRLIHRIDRKIVEGEAFSVNLAEIKICDEMESLCEDEGTIEGLELSFYYEELDNVPYYQAQTFLAYKVEFPGPSYPEPVLAGSPNASEWGIRYNPDQNGELTSIRLYDPMGRLVKTYPGSQRSFDLSGLRVGTYILELSTASRTWVLKATKI